MPYKIVKTPKGYGVLNTEKNVFKSRNTTKEKAERQMSLLESISKDKEHSKTNRGKK